MITTICDGCGGRFEVDDTWAGRRARCGRCGTIVAIPELDPFTRDDSPLSLAGGDDEDPRPEPADVMVEAFPEDAPILLDHAAGEKAEAEIRVASGVVTTEPTRSFWADLGYTFVPFFGGLGWLRLVFILPLYLLCAFMGFALYIGIIAQVLILGWVAAYCFGIVEDTCAGEDRLPPLEIQPGDGIVGPFFSMVGTFLWVAWPFLLWDGLLYWHGAILPDPLADKAIMIALAALAMLLWPMTILTVAIQGFSLNLIRHDKLLVAIGRHLGSYLIACVFLAAAMACLQALLLFSQLAIRASVRDWFGTWCLASFGASVASAYSAVIAMRIIGLFYRNHKRSFAWEAE